MAAAVKNHGMTYKPETNTLTCACGREMIALVALTPDTADKAGIVALHIIYADQASAHAEGIRRANRNMRIFAFGQDPLPRDIFLSIFKSLMLFAPK